MADPNWAHGRSSNTSGIGQYPQPGPPGAGSNAMYMASKAGGTPPTSGQVNNMGGQPNIGHQTNMGHPPPGSQAYHGPGILGQPTMSSMVSQPGYMRAPPPGSFGTPQGQYAPPHTATSGAPPGTFGAPPGTFGAPTGNFHGVNTSNSATPPPFSSNNLLTAPSTGIVRSNSTPAMPPGHFGPPSGQQMVNGLPSRPAVPGPQQPPTMQVRPQGQPRPPSHLPTRPPLHNGQTPGQAPGQLPRPPQSGQPQWSGHTQNVSIQPPTGMARQMGPGVSQAGPPQSGSGPPRFAGPPPRAVAPPAHTGAPPPHHGVQPIPGQVTSQAGIAPPPQTGALPIQGQAVPQPGGRPTELPLPYQGHGQYSHQVPGLANMATPGITPNTSEPPSQKSSRAPSPVTGQKYDALEGQFTPSAQGGAFPAQQPHEKQPQVEQHTAGYGQPPVSGMQGQVSPPIPGYPGQIPPPNSGAQIQPTPPMPGVYGQQPPLPTSQPVAAAPMPPPVTQTASGAGITGRRQYPQMAQAPAGVAPPGQPAMPGPTAQPGVPTYPANNAYPAPNNTATLNSSFNNMKLQHDMQRPLNLLQEKNILPQEDLELPKPNLPTDYKKANCSPEIFRCTLNSIPNTQSLLTKSRLPLGILIHPFKDLAQLPVIQSSVIVRCRSCRTYINPFVTFVDMRRWKCNLCYRANDLPEEFNYDPVSKTYGEPQRRPEIRSGTIEFIAPSEYMLRPPQPAVYLFVLDVSYNARETGYLHAFCQTLLDELDRLPGDSRTQIGFLAFDRSLYYFNLAEGLSQPQMLVVSDTEEVFIPAPDNLLVNLQESRELVAELLNILPEMFKDNMETGSALGPALESAYKLMSPTGGRVSVFQTLLPSVGNGSLKSREDPNERSGKKVHHLGPATDFYKRLALDCSAQQIGVDLFLLNSQYADIASIGCISKFSGGTVHYFPAYHAVTNPPEAERFEGVLRRYFTRKIGFEAVMRIRCSRGLSIHTFHGNFFVRSTDLLSLPNVNPDAGFGMQMSIEDTIDANYVCFQAALLYTSSKGERRIRVHTLAIPISQQLSEIHASADQLAIVSLLAKMAVDKSLSSSLGDARDALINSSIDMLGSYGSTLTSSQRQGMLPCPYTLRLQALFTLGLLKSLAFRIGLSTKVDDRVNSMELCKNLPACYLLLMVYPNLYPIHNLDDKNNVISKGDSVVPQPPLLQLSSANMDRHGVYLMDTGSRMFMWVGAAISDQFCREVLDKPNFASIPDPLFELPELDNPTSELVRAFIGHLNDQRPYPASLTVMREDSRARMHFLEHMVEDRTESTFSYYEYLQHLQKEIKS